MDNKKFEQLIDLIINENEEKARELFHDIVVEKSREIYESIMDEEMMGDMDEGMGGQVGGLLDEINAEEEMSEGEDDMEDDLGELSDLDDEVDIDSDEVADLEADDDVEDAVIRIEDKLDQLMAEFEQLMGNDEEMGDEEEAFDDEEAADDEEMAADDEEEGAEEMMEAVQLQKVAVTHGDNGVQTKSPGLANSGQAGMDSKPVKFSGAAESVPTSPKGPSNAYAKGETQVKGAGSFKNAPGQKGQDLSAAGKPVTSQASGVNTKSPVAESRKSTKRRV